MLFITNSVLLYVHMKEDLSLMVNLFKLYGTGNTVTFYYDLLLFPFCNTISPETHIHHFNLFLYL